MNSFVMENLWDRVPYEHKQMCFKMCAAEMDAENAHLKRVFEQAGLIKSKENEKKKQEINNIIIITSIVVCVPVVIFILKKIV
jgi:hypothetical protein